MTTRADTVHRWSRDQWADLLCRIAPAALLEWVSVRASGADSTRTVLPWEPSLSLRYDERLDAIVVATPGDVHRIARPLALFSLSEGADIYRLVVVRFDGGLDLIDVLSVSRDDARGERTSPVPSLALMP